MVIDGIKLWKDFTRVIVSRASQIFMRIRSMSMWIFNEPSELEILRSDLELLCLLMKFAV